MSVNTNEPDANAGLRIRSATETNDGRQKSKGGMMTDRTKFGAAILASLAITVAASAPAQDRRARLREMLQRPQQPSNPTEAKITAPGTYRFSFVHDGLTRQYIVYVPASVARNKAAPLLLGLHGGGGNMEFQSNNYGLKQKANQASFVAVFPNGYSRFPNGMLATWNAGACCGKAAENKVDDVGFLKAVIERVSRQMPIDRNRIYTTGMSNGAMMSYRLACELPTLIRAIAPVAGTDNTLACTPSRPVPVILFHARDDSHVSFDGGAGTDALAKVDFKSVPATIDKWLAIDRATGLPKRIVSVPGATCDLYPATSGGAPVQACITDTGGHSWPGTPSVRANKNPSQAISANDLMWQFFQSL